LRKIVPAQLRRLSHGKADLSISPGLVFWIGEGGLYVLSELEIHATIPAKDINRARQYYEQKLGLIPTEEAPGGLVYRNNGVWFFTLSHPNAGTAQHTLMGWEVGDIEREVADLKARGAVFEGYDSPFKNCEQHRDDWTEPGRLVQGQ
jgi:hypothetical protein